MSDAIEDATREALTRVLVDFLYAWSGPVGATRERPVPAALALDLILAQARVEAHRILDARWAEEWAARAAAGAACRSS